MEIKKINTIPGSDSVVCLVSDSRNISSDLLSGSELKYIEQQHEKNKKDLIFFNRINKWVFIQFINEVKDQAKRLELLRRSGAEIIDILNRYKESKIILHDIEGNVDELLALTEGISLGNYQFLKYKKKEVEETRNSVRQLHIFSNKIDQDQIDLLEVQLDAVGKCRDLVNEPVSYLNADKFSKEIKKYFDSTGVKVEVLNKKKIESLKMGGLLAVNKGSVDAPTFTILEWKPENAVNRKPYVFVGKGVVYDSGGMNIKIQDFMNDMKSDMAGAAAVAMSVYAIARAKLPVSVVALIPATDNRLNGNAMVSGDVISMANGSTVEVINTDAEGRLILADALTYAKKYKPQLVIDLATLTGSAVRALGKGAIAGMQVKADRPFGDLVKSGMKVYERIAELPMWDDYGESLKSSIADLKNLGGTNAGAIVAGKFLEFFTDYPFIHLDIAGPAFLEKRNSYRGVGGTGTGVRLLFDFIHNIVKSKV